MKPSIPLSITDSRRRCGDCLRLISECNCVAQEPSETYCPSTREHRHGWLPGSVPEAKNGVKKEVPIKICGACRWYKKISLLQFKQLFREDFWRVVAAQVRAEQKDQAVAETESGKKFTTEVTTGDGKTAARIQ